ncbi:MAG: SH3 domain-containing protein [Desulfobacterales bacterium]
MQKGRVKSTTGLNLRFKPNGDKIGVLGHNEEFTIVDEVTFYRVKSQSGHVGYVHGDYIEKIPTSSVLPKTNGGNYEPEFKPVVFIHDSFIGETARVDQDFVTDLQRLSEYASQCNLKIWVTSSLRPLNNQFKGAIVKPASRSCHHIGHAIDMNLFYEGEIYNSKMLIKSNHINLSDNITGFFELIRADKVLRWGGDFKTEDPVHIDNDFYHEQEIFYLAKLDSRILQSNV